MTTLGQIVVLGGPWQDPEGNTPDGSVDFQLDRPLVAPVSVSATPIGATLVGEAVAQALWPNDGDAVPVNTRYQVTENIVGAPPNTYWIQVPSEPVGSRTVTDADLVLSSFVMISETASFTDDDVDAYVLVPGFPVGTQITEVIDGSTARLSQPAPATRLNATVLIGASATLAALNPLN